MRSIAMALFLEPFKAAVAEGAVVELKLRLLAGTVPSLRKYEHQQRLEDIENELAKHFGNALSDEEKRTLRLCRQLRNKVLHSDFRAARGKINELGVATQSGGVTKIDIPTVSVATIAEKVRRAKAGAEGIVVANTASTDVAGVYGWFLEAGRAGDFQKASEAFRSAAAIVDRLIGAA